MQDCQQSCTATSEAKQSLAAAPLSAAHLRVLIAASVLIRASPAIRFTGPLIIQALKVLLQQAPAFSL